MTIVLLATDSDHVFAEVDATLASDSCDVLRVKRGADVLPAVRAKEPDLVILDLQIGSMGGVATCLAIRQEEGAWRLEERPVALLLDRQADVFLAQESGADGWLVKPIDSLRLRRMAKALMAGESLREGEPASVEPTTDDPQAEHEAGDDPPEEHEPAEDHSAGDGSGEMAETSN